MISADLSRRTQELAAAGIAFVTATVVRAQSPTSVEPGSVALVLGDGTIEGFVGGVCAEHSVRAYSLQALASGEAVLLRILPEPVEGREIGPEGIEVASEDGAVTVQNPCLSGGAIEIFLEPVPSVPRVLVVGRTPIANAVRRIGAELALDMVGVAEDGPDPDPGDLAIVVAGHGRDELRPLRRALEADVPYVGLVASEKRGAGILEELRAGGVAGGAARPDRRPRRHPHRLAHRGRGRGLGPGEGRRGAPLLTARAQTCAGARRGRGRPRLRHDRRGRGRHALGRTGR